MNDRLTTLEIGRVLLELKANYPKMTTKEIATATTLSERHCQRLMKLARESATAPVHDGGE